MYTLLVVAWGAFVRASVSGDGCGANWPHCGEGTIIPSLQHAKTLIEFSHRTSSELLGLFVIALLIWAYRAYPAKHPARLGAALAFIFTITEGLVGRQLVLAKLVAHNTSPDRAVWMSAHLCNTFILLGALTLTAWWASHGKPLRLQGQGALGWAFGLGLLSTLALAVTGAIAALGDTLFPAADLLQGIQEDFSPTAHFLQQLRPIHPFLAASVSLYLILIAGLATHLRPSPQVRQFARLMGTLFLTQMAIGLVNLALRAPIPMQLVHLLFADLVWLSLVLLSATALAEGVPQVERVSVETALPAGAATWQDYLALTKPRVISLLLFTTLTAMVIAAGGWPGAGLFLATAVGLYMAAGAANAINMVLEQDLDSRMKRTSRRPTVTQRISSPDALRFAFGLAVGSFALLWTAASLLSALMALAGLVFYVVVYTMWLKRRTWSNIVIGGAAGAFPPLVGWTAVTPDLSALAWCLFAIIFMWTPVHFWALALLIKEDYAEAGIPMLPVVRGERYTVAQIAFYTVLTIAITFLPALLYQGANRVVGPIYLMAAILLNAVLLWMSLKLYQRPERRQARSLFHYSMVYLALLFLAMAIDRAAHWV
ncbi:MAG: heme o synthase [Armatimonadota bacterium]|nr:heme o synthase [Armatimonadota bacterium]